MILCTRCFNVENECRCKYPFFQEIDDGFVSIIKKLNSKGFSTLFCCSGHADEEYVTSHINLLAHTGIQVYIKFTKDGYNKLVNSKMMNIMPRFMTTYKSTCIIEYIIPCQKDARKILCNMMTPKDFDKKWSAYLKKVWKELEDWVDLI